ncbi:hypothetical protein M378DRAFT_637065 [Amanita muscaria Koide BX008]|uniref:Uncharacterized protein n=1 Tax=Amanita muscaria (strain Koide BX008) TaxID=946122 RepID=A0A0C2SLS6_AMAMK|nr:hypothetical protein M378DRAFT_637065 [Amanita muscaria Koide BX008]
MKGSLEVEGQWGQTEHCRGGIAVLQLSCRSLGRVMRRWCCSSFSDSAADVFWSASEWNNGTVVFVIVEGEVVGSLLPC